MAKITFITLYDQSSIGIRIMSRILNDAGHQSNIIYLKAMKLDPLDTPNQGEAIGQIIYDGKLFACIKDMWTHQEANILIEKLKSDNPDIIGLSNRSPIDKWCFGLIDLIKINFPDKILLAGGFGPFLNPESYLKYVDFVAFGECEETILDIADTINAGKSISHINNLIYKLNGKIIRNSVNPPKKNIDQFPFPLYDTPGICQIDNNTLIESDPGIASGDYPILAQRGCTAVCSYCSSGQFRKLYKLYGYTIPPVRFRSVNNIIQELKENINKSGCIKKVRFVNDYLTGPKNYLIKLFNRYKNEINLPFFAQLHAYQITESPEIFNVACEAGLVEGTIGIQHGDESFCSDIFHRKMGNNTIIKAANLYYSKKIKTAYHFITDIAVEKRENFLKSLSIIPNLPMKYGSIVVSKLQVFPFSPLQQILEENNKGTCDQNNRWYINGIMYYLRSIFDNNTFEKLFTSIYDSIDDFSFSSHDSINIFFTELIAELKNNDISILQSPLVKIPQFFKALISDSEMIRREFIKNENQIILALKKNPYDALDDVLFESSSFAELFISFLKRESITGFGPSEFMANLYKSYLDDFASKPVAIWGAASGFISMKEIFSKSNIEAFIDNDLSKHETFINSIPVKPPYYLKNRDIPVFICSNFKKQIYNQIKANFSHLSIVP